MARKRGLSARLKLTLSYVGFVVISGVLLLAAVWAFLLRGNESVLRIPDLSDFARALDPTNFGPAVFAPASIMVLGFLLIFGLVGGWILAGWMLAPLARITTAARTAAKGSLTHRIALEGRWDEFRELADSFDAMLARLEARDVEQQRFAANASHELRTPLAIMQTLLDIAHKTRESNELDERLRIINARAIGLTEALLLLSRADHRSFASENVDLSLIAEEATETLLPLAEKRRIDLRTSGNIARAIGSPALLLQLTTNLVHNGIVHNVEGGIVEIHTAVERESAVLTVANTGNQLSAQLVSTLTEPFQRGGERIRSHHAGVGLGLTIVKSIVRAHDGNLSLSPRENGGLCVTVRLPLSGQQTE